MVEPVLTAVMVVVNGATLSGDVAVATNPFPDTKETEVIWLH
jgi:hypothetical protein